MENSLTGKDILASVLKQIKEANKEPTKIYMDHRAYELLLKYLNENARYPNNVPVFNLKIKRLPVFVDYDFPEPKVI